MKICHVNTTLIHKTGSARRTYPIVRALADTGHEVFQIVGRDYQPGTDWDMTNISLSQLPELVKHVSSLRDVSAVSKLYRFFKKVRPEVVHTHLAKAGILGRVAARLAGVPTIIHTVHGPTFADGIPPARRRVYRALERLCGRMTDHFVFVGEELRQEYIRSGICPRERSHVIRTGRPKRDYASADALGTADLESTRQEFSREPNAVYIGYVGRIVPSKNHAFAIRMLNQLRCRGGNAHLVLVGEGHLAEERAHEQRLRLLAEELGVGKFVHFAGFKVDVLRYTKAMDVLVLPSLYEGLPNVAVEAGMVGRAMVSCDMGGIREVLVDGVTGYIVGQGDLEAFTGRVAELAENPRRAAAMGAAARRRVEGLYDLDTMVREKLAFYESLPRAVRP